MDGYETALLEEWSDRHSNWVLVSPGISGGAFTLRGKKLVQRFRAPG